jgi:hypothetical protein
MTSPRKRIARMCLAALAVLDVAGCSDSTPTGCPKETCASGAWMHIPIAVKASDLEQAVVTVCRNAECHDWPLPSLPAGGEGFFPDVSWVTGALSLKADQSIALDIQWTVDEAASLDGGTPGVGPSDGDHYVVSLTTSAGQTSTLLDQLATYQTKMPNGPDCPPICMQAVLRP